MGDREKEDLMEGVSLTGVPVPGIDVALIPAQMMEITARGIFMAGLPWLAAAGAVLQAVQRQ